MKKTFKKSLAMIIALSMIIISSLSAMPVMAEGLTFSGTGESGDPYIIDSSEKFAAINTLENYLTKTYKITADITVTSGLGDSTNKFTGTIIGDKGNGEKPVVTLALSSTTENLGFINYFESGLIDNFIFEGTVSGTSNVGAVAGTVRYASIKNIINKATVSGTANVAGIAGARVKSGVTENCINKADITATGGNVAGIHAQMDSGSVLYSANIGNIITTGGGSNAGGISAYTKYGEAITFTECYNIGNISGTVAGGITARAGQDSAASKAKIADCYNAGKIEGSTIGGIAARFYGEKTASVTNCYNAGSFGETAGYFIVNPENAIITNCYYLDTVNGTNGTATENLPVAKTSEQMKSLNNFTSEAGSFTDTVWETNTNIYNYEYPTLKYNEHIELEIPTVADTIKGSGTSGDPYIIDSSEKFAAIPEIENYLASKVYKITEDIAVNAGLGDSTNKFSGTIIGDKENGEKPVVTLNLSATTDNLGFINYFESGSIENIIFEGTVSGASNVGAVAGTVRYASIKNIISNVTVSGTSNVSGIAGVRAKNGITENCINKGNVTASTGNAAGIISDVCEGTISKCANLGAINGTSAAGGILAYIHYDNVITISQCYNIGIISGETFTGGIVGRTMSKTVVTDCYNTGVINSSKNAGGICADSQNASFVNCYNVGSFETVTGKWAYYIASPTASTMTNCYYLNTVNGGNGGEKENVPAALSSDQMKLLSSFTSDAGSFADSVWEIKTNIYDYYYPTLKNNEHIELTLPSIENKTVSNLKISYNKADDSYTAIWDANALAAGYKVSVNGSEEITVDTNSYLLNGITLGETYTVSVKMYDDTTESQPVEISIDTRFGGGNGEEATPYIVANIRHLNNVRLESSSYFVQTEDIDEEFTNPIAEFSGSYKGDGETPKKINLNINITDGTNYAAFIAQLKTGAVIDNIKTTGSVTGGEGTSFVAGIAAYAPDGWSTAKISNCVNYASVRKTGKASNQGVGGIIAATVSGFSITGCSNYGEIYSSLQQVGGIIGIGGKSIVISGCKNYGEVTSEVGYVGGIGGVVKGSVSESANYAAVTSVDNYMAGGIVGDGSGWGGTSKLYIERCYNVGDVISAGAAGGILGRATGLSGTETDNVLIENSYNYGNLFISEEDSVSGGIIGQIGFEGRNLTANIVNCYDAGNIDIGLAGNVIESESISLTINNSYYLTADTTTATSTYGTPYTSEMLKGLLSADKTFDAEIWEIADGYDYPQLSDLPHAQYFLRISVIVGEGGYTDGKKYIYVTPGETATVTVSPDEGYKINNVKFNGITVSEALAEGESFTYTTEPVTENSAIVASFEMVTDVLPEALSDIRVFAPSYSYIVPVTLKTNRSDSDVISGVNIIAAGNAPAYRGYTIKEYGILLSDTSDVNADMYDEKAVGVSMSESGAFGIVFTGNLKLSTTYYLRGYVVYSDANGDEHTILTPVSNTTTLSK